MDFEEDLSPFDPLVDVGGLGVSNFAFFGTEVLLGGSIVLEPPFSFFFESDFFPDDLLDEEEDVALAVSLFEDDFSYLLLLPFSLASFSELDDFSLSLELGDFILLFTLPDEEDTEADEVICDGVGWVGGAERFIGVPNKFSKEFFGDDLAAPAAGLDFPPPDEV